MDQRILITGAAGFIGSNLCESLSKKSNNEVYSLDNYSIGTKDNNNKPIKTIRFRLYEKYIELAWQHK